VFEASTLDDRNWVQDFGGLKQIKQWLHDNFDHTLCVAADDPMLEELLNLQLLNLAVINILPSVGCEKFSEYIFNYVESVVVPESLGRVRVRSVEVREHGGNSARY
jgi:6-pyruvoyltetrahydropterin/6-carboxytetrahydropterin synthase